MIHEARKDAPIPNKTPKEPIKKASPSIVEMINDVDAPRDFRIPISFRRSVIVVYIDSKTKIVETNAPRPTSTLKNVLSPGMRS